MVRLSWGEGEREWWRGWCMDTQSPKDGDILREKRSCWPLVLIDKERKKGRWSMLKVIWPGVVKHFSSTCSLCPWVYTAGCSWFFALSHGLQTQPDLSHNAKHSTHTLANTAAQGYHHFSHTGHIFVTMKEHSLLISQLVREKCWTS